MSRRRMRRPVWNLHEHAHYQREDLLFLLRTMIALEFVSAAFHLLRLVTLTWM